jgi:hypothetical protein
MWHVFNSLLLRYSILRHNSSKVKVEKIQFVTSTGETENVCLGLKAATFIASDTPILATASSLSSDLLDYASLSAIASSPKQLGPQGTRLILGAFRFVNHDCKPNAQVRTNLSLDCACTQHPSVWPNSKLSCIYDPANYRHPMW